MFTTFIISSHIHGALFWVYMNKLIIFKAKSLGSPSIVRRCDTFESNWCLMDVYPSFCCCCLRLHTLYTSRWVQLRARFTRRVRMWPHMIRTFSITIRHALRQRQQFNFNVVHCTEVLPESHLTVTVSPGSCLNIKTVYPGLGCAL